MPVSTGRHTPATYPSTSRVGRTSPLFGTTRVPAAVGVREQRAVPHRHQPRRSRGRFGRQVSTGYVEELDATRSFEPDELVAERRDGLLDRWPVNGPELGDVLHRGGSKALEIAV